jgi:ribosomal protein S18 acetylase RimI-like enzyme
MADIQFTESLAGLKPEHLSEFFVGWQKHPSAEKHLELLQKSDYIVLAKDGEQVVGFITAISDQVLSAYIPLLEVLPEYQKQGIGQELLRHMLKKLEGFYMVDVVCDPAVQEFYKKVGFKEEIAMIKRNYDAQEGV